MAIKTYNDEDEATKTANAYLGLINEQKNKLNTQTAEQAAIEDAQAAQFIANRNAKIQKALAGYERMMKYLPTLQKDQGRAGLGISESGYIEAAANRNNLLANAMRDYDAQVLAYNKALEDERKQQLAELDQRELDLYKTVDAEERAEQRQIRSEQKATEAQERATADNYLLSLYKDSIDDTTSEEELDAIYERAVAAGMMSESALKQLKATIDEAKITMGTTYNSYAAQKEAASNIMKSIDNAMKENARFKSNGGMGALKWGNWHFKSGDEFYITDKNGNKKDVTSMGDVTDKDVLYIGSQLEDGTVFEYNGKIYMTTPAGEDGGRVIQIRYTR